MLKFPVDRVQSAIFVGIEQEGYFKGKRTLFVVGNPSREAVARAILFKAEEVDNVYLGAGGRFDYPYDANTIEWYCNNFTYVTIESPTLDLSTFLIWRRIHWMLPLIWNGQAVPEAEDSLNKITKLVGTSDYKAAAMRLQLKFDFGHIRRVVVTPFDRAVFSNFDDYEGDEVLWLQLYPQDQLYKAGERLEKGDPIVLVDENDPRVLHMRAEDKARAAFKAKGMPDHD